MEFGAKASGSLDAFLFHFAARPRFIGAHEPAVPKQTIPMSTKEQTKVLAQIILRFLLSLFDKARVETDSWKIMDSTTVNSYFTVNQLVVGWSLSAGDIFTLNSNT